MSNDTIKNQITIIKVTCDIVMALWSLFFGVLLFMSIFEIGNVWMDIEDGYDVLMFLAILVQGTYGSVYFIKKVVTEIIALVKGKREKEARTKRNRLKNRAMGISVE